MGWDVNSVQGVGRVGGEAAAVLVVLALAMLAPLALVVSVLFGGDTPVVNTTNRAAFSSCSPSPFSREARWVKKLDGEGSRFPECRYGKVPRNGPQANRATVTSPTGGPEAPHPS
jgi:hypothetical protein